MERITFINSNGDSVSLGRAAPFFLKELEGTGGVTADIQTQKAPYQDGETYIDTLLEPRAISITTVIMTKTHQELAERRRQLARVFNPKLGPGVLLYETGTTIKEIEAVVDLAPVFPSGKENRGIAFQTALIDLVCPSPFWTDDYTESKEIVTWLGGISFPLVLPTTFAMKGPPIINIVNKGDVETPVRIEFQGPATNPKIIKRDTGEYIQVNRELVYGDTLVVTTDFGAKRVEINGENVFNWIDLGSSFWQLDVGDNVIEYSSDDPVEPAAVSISYRNRYVGV